MSSSLKRKSKGAILTGDIASTPALAMPAPMSRHRTRPGGFFGNLAVAASLAAQASNVTPGLIALRLMDKTGFAIGSKTKKEQ
jgi:hypothetical protein